MEKFIRKISTAFIKKLPKQKTFYTSKDFTQAGFPLFLTGRLKTEIEKQAMESVSLPDSEWINTDAPAVQEAWQNFSEAVKTEIRLPENAADKIITNAVENCLKMAVQPKRSIPVLLFNGDDELDYAELKKRSAEITINGHLAYGLVRYMEKKQKDSIYIENARTVIEKIDQKLVSDYNPLNWLEILKPVFGLAGPSVDSDLLRMFFEDKGLHRAAKKFDLLDDIVDETGFIEIMSSAELLDFEGYSDDQQNLFVDSSVMKKEDHQKEFEEDDEEVNLEPEAKREEISEDEDSDDLNSQFGLDIEDDDDLQDEEPAGVNIKTEEEVDDEVEKTDDKDEIDEDDLNSFFITEEEPDETEEAPFDLDEEDDLPVEKEPQANIKPEEEIEGEPEETEAKPVTDAQDEISSKEDEDEEESEQEVTLLNRFTFDDSFSDEEDEESDEDSQSTIYSELNLVKEDREQVTLQSLFDQVDEDEEEDEDEKITGLFTQDESEDEEETYESEIQSDSESKLPADDEETDSPFLYNDFTEEEEPDEFIPQRISDQSDEDDDDDDEVPMWRSFLERDDVEDESDFQFEDDDDEIAETDEDGFIEEPIFDLTTDEPEIDEKIGQISQWLEDEQDRFVEKLFGNSDAAYEQALSEIVDFDDWKNASKFIEKEIFSRNRIDVYDEIAVDFTDRLHTYFMEYKS